MLTLTDCIVERLALPKLSAHEVSNPSLVRLSENRYYVAYKGVNYNLKKAGYSAKTYAGFRVPFSDAQNYFAVVQWHAGPTVERSGFLEDRHIRSRPVAYAGLQDIRLFSLGARLYALAGAHSYLPGESGTSAKQTRMMLCAVNGRTLQSVAVFPSRQPKEKNWMPWPRDDGLYLQYHCDPYEVLKVDGSRLSLAAGPKKVAGLEGFFGGSPIVGLGRHYIGLAHLKVMDHPVVDSHPLPGMAYFHKAIIYGADMEVLDASALFKFEGERVEFCCGIAIDEGDIVFSYGIWDIEARLMKMKTREFLEAVGLGKWVTE